MHHRLAAGVLLVAAALGVAHLGGGHGRATADDPGATADHPVDSARPASSEAALAVLEKVILQLTLGPAFDARLRQTIWTSGRDVTATGVYEQAGQGSGRYNLMLKLDDGSNRHRLQQICDGRLAWKQTKIGDRISVTRVNLGALTETVRLSRKKVDLPPKLRVGGFVEMLDTIRRDFTLRLKTGALEKRPVLILEGELTDTARKRILTNSERETWTELCPSYVRVAIAVNPTDNADASASQADSPGSQRPADVGLPIRFEYCADPVTVTSADGESTTTRRPTVSLVEMYSVQKIAPPPAARFAFRRDDSDVNFVDETPRYLEPYGLRMTQAQRKRLRR